MKRWFILLTILLLTPVMPAMAQMSDFTYNGYIKILPSAALDRDWENEQFDNLLHNRLNFRWYANRTLTAGLEVRNRCYMGDTVKNTPGFADFIDRGQDWWDLSVIALDEESVVVHSVIDRLWLDYYHNDLQIRVGRQRINWGLNLVWNPNDIFNAFSFFDFDYEERPGTDGVRLQYYTGVASKFELALKGDDDTEQMAGAALYKFNRWEYDFQLFGGMYQNEQVVLGSGWAGQVLDGGFRGELSYYIPTDEADGDNYLVAALSGDYTFENSLYLHAEALYNERGTTGKAGGLSLLTAPPSNQLSPARHSIFGEIAYQISPLVRGNIAGIMNPHDQSFFVGPSLTWSVKTNWDLLLIAQLYQGERGTEFGDAGKLFFARLRWSF